MPLIHAYLAEGNSQEQKAKLMLALTEAVERSIGAKRQAIRVMLHEFPRNHYMAGGIIPSEPTTQSASGATEARSST